MALYVGEQRATGWVKHQGQWLEIDGQQVTGWAKHQGQWLKFNEAGGALELDIFKPLTPELRQEVKEVLELSTAPLDFEISGNFLTVAGTYDPDNLKESFAIAPLAFDLNSIAPNTLQVLAVKSIQPFSIFPAPNYEYAYLSVLMSNLFYTVALDIYPHEQPAGRNSKVVGVKNSDDYFTIYIANERTIIYGIERTGALWLVGAAGFGQPFQFMKTSAPALSNQRFLAIGQYTYNGLVEPKDIVLEVLATKQQLSPLSLSAPAGYVLTDYFGTPL